MESGIIQLSRWRIFELIGREVTRCHIIFYGLDWLNGEKEGATVKKEEGEKGRGGGGDVHY